MADDLKKLLDEAYNEFQGTAQPQARNMAPADDVGAMLRQSFEEMNKVPAAPVVHPTQTPMEVPEVPQLQEPEDTSKAPTRSFAEGFTGGVKRGWQQTLATIPQLKGIYAESTGDMEGASRAFEEAQAIEAKAPQQQQEFSKISGLEDAMFWGVEKFGEQVPVLGSLLLGTGGAGVAANLVGRGLLSSVGARALLSKTAMATTGLGMAAGMETAGIGGEIREATGSYRPEVAVPSGVAAGMLELITPLKMARGLAGQQIGKTTAGTIARGAVTEATTELGQEAIAVLAREYADPNFELLSPSTGWRLAESFAAGGLVGGGVHAVTAPFSGERRGEQQNISAEEAQSYNLRPVSWLYDKVSEWKDPRLKEVREVMRMRPDLDSAEAGALLDTVGIHWINAGVRGLQSDAIGRFTEGETKRYIHPLFSQEIMNSTDLEEALAITAPGVDLKQEVKEVNQGSLSPANITAGIKDLPESAASPRVYFLPGTTAEEKKTAIDALEQAIVTGDFTIYKEATDNGLRVIPSYGKSFIYGGQVEARAITAMPASGRSIIPYSSAEKLTAQERGFTVEDTPLTFDLNAFAPGQVTGLPSLLSLPQEFMDRLIFPAGLSEADKSLVRTEIVKKYAEQANVKQLWETLIDKGIYIPPKATDELLVFASGSKIKDKLTQGIKYPLDANKQKLAKVNLFVNESNKATEIITNDRRADKVLNQVKQIWPYIDEIMTSINIPKLTEIEVVYDRGNTNLGWYYPSTYKVVLNAGYAYGIEKQLLSTLIHEVGHHITYVAWSRSSADQQQAIWQAYRRHLLAFEKDRNEIGRFRQLLPNKAGENVMTLGDDFISYTVSFSEWLAEQTVRWVVDKKLNYSLLDNLFTRVHRDLVRYYEAIKDTPYAKNLTPDVEFEKWMEWLKLKDSNNPQAMREFADSLYMREDNPLGLRAAQIVARTVEEMKNLFPAGWTVTVGNAGEGNTAVTLRNKKAVIIGVNALEMGVRGTVAHEAVHATRELFTPEEWAKLSAGVPQDVKMLVRQHWKTFYTKQAIDMKMTEAERNAFVEDRLNEEGVAIIVGMRASGLSFQPVINSLLDKLIQFFRRVAQAFGYELRWLSREQIMQDFFNGEIAARSQDTQLREIYSRWLEQDNDIEQFTALDEGLQRDKWFEPLGPKRPEFTPEAPANDTRAKTVRVGNIAEPANDQQAQRQAAEPDPVDVKQVGPDLWVAVFKERLENRQVYAAQYRFYINVPQFLVKDTVVRKHEQVKQGQSVGVVFLSHNPKGFEVDYVNVKKEFRKAKATRGEGFATSFYKYIEKDLNQAMKPSGMLLPDGYQMWKRRDASAVRYHVYDEVDNTWYSPNYIRNSVNLYQGLKDSGKANPQQVQDLVRYKKLMAKVDKKAWLDPELDKMFQLRLKQDVYNTGMQMAEQERAYQENILTDGNMPSTGYEQAMAGNMEVSQVENAKTLGVDINIAAPAQPEILPMRNILKSNQLTAKQRKALKGVFAEADRISSFSKKWWGIHQLAWANPHISYLQSYKSIIEQWAAKVEMWISRADQVARDWDSELNQTDKANLAELLFYMTEMRYRTPQEVSTGVVRHPTQQEIADAFRTYKLGPAAQQIYARIEGEFASFLQEIERISIAAIEREFLGQRVNGAISQAEQKALNELAAEMTALRAKPYFPMTRFGEYTLTVRDPQTRKIEAFYTFENQQERNEYITVAAKQWLGNDLQIGRLPENVMEFAGIPGPLLRRIKASLPGLTTQQGAWLDQLSHLMAPEGSFRKRMMKRQETPGYSLDAFRVFANYFQTGARYIARLEFKDQAQAEIDGLHANAKANLADTGRRTEIGDFMQSHLNYMLEGGRDWAKTKAFIAMWHLGYSPIAAAMNLTQVPMVTIPYLSSMFGYGASLRAVLSVSNALKASFGGTWHNAPWAGYEKGRQELIARGKIDAGQAPELAAYASANNLYKTAAGNATARFYRGLAQHSMWMFGKAERFNRELTYAAVFKMAMENPRAKLVQQIANNKMGEINELMSKTNVSYDEAVAILAASEAIDRTHGIYAPWARPAFMRVPIAGTVLVFFGYVQMMLYALRHNPGRAKHLFMLLAIAGMMGLPGADDLDKLVEAVARRIFGKDFSPKNEARKFINDLTEGTMLHKNGADIFLHGIGRYGFGVGLLPEGIGAPRFDVSANMSMGKIVPGMGEAFKAWGTSQDWNKIMGGASQEAAGAGFGVMFSMLQFLSTSADPGSWDWKKWEKVMPRAVKAASKGIRYGVTGEETMKSGASFYKFDLRDPDDVATIVTQFLGATPTALNQKWQANAEMQEKFQFYAAKRKILYEQLAKATQKRDVEARTEILEDVRKYNEEVKKVPGFAALTISMQQLKNSLQQRNRARALQERDLPAVKSQIPAAREMMKDYPEVEWRRVK